VSGEWRTVSAESLATGRKKKNRNWSDATWRGANNSISQPALCELHFNVPANLFLFLGPRRMGPQYGSAGDLPSLFRDHIRTGLEKHVQTTL